MKFAPVTARASNWGQTDGTQRPIVRISGGRSTVAVEYDDLPRLIAELATLLHEARKEGTK